jgi:hypothetical protein
MVYCIPKEEDHGQLRFRNPLSLDQNSLAMGNEILMIFDGLKIEKF